MMNAVLDLRTVVELGGLLVMVVVHAVVVTRYFENLRAAVMKSIADTREELMNECETIKAAMLPRAEHERTCDQNNARMRDAIIGLTNTTNGNHALANDKWDKLTTAVTTVAGEVAEMRGALSVRTTSRRRR